MNKISKLANDIAIALEANKVRIEAPIRGTGLVGVEIPSKIRKRIDFSDNHLKKGTMDIPIGMDVYGQIIYKNLAEMPHLLIAGATGSGKSVMLNVLLTALIKQMNPNNLKLVLIDPKRVELNQFASSKHLMQPIVYEVEEAAKTLQGLVTEMEDRYSKLAKEGVRVIDDYSGHMPRIVAVIDEFADLMLSGGKVSKKAVKADITEEVFDGVTKTKSKFQKEIEPEQLSSEQLIVLLAQKARAVGIHLVLATQRPSADVVTGLIKANIPTKIAFMTTSGVNSKIILDQLGAEELTGKGDMLFLDPSESGLKRLQGLYA